MVAVVAGDAKARMEEAIRKAEAETARLEIKWMSLLLEIGAAKDEVSSLQPQASEDKEAMEEDYQKALEVIFVYGYGCCAFKHIFGDLPMVLDSMPDSSIPLPPKFYATPSAPQSQQPLRIQRLS